MRSFGSQRLATWLWLVRRRLERNRYQRLRRKVSPRNQHWAGYVEEPRQCVLCGTWYTIRKHRREGPPQRIRFTGLCTECAQQKAHPLFRAFFRQVLVDDAYGHSSAPA